MKPANLILDTEGKVWITDFGLAKLDQQDLTQTGDIVGTLRYMAPERFAGDADRRADIYSLGLTLYEMCTLKSAFENDRGTLVSDFASRDSVISPRTIDETIPTDLETIILKAIEALPERRYQSAQAMAEDLELFLTDRPIKARRASWVEKCWRVCRRNPVVSSLVVLSAVLMIVITAGSIEFARTEFNARKESQQRLYLANLDQAKMRRLSRQPGQRTESIEAIKTAVGLLPNMDFDASKLAEARIELRSEAIAALSLTDIETQWTAQTLKDGWGDRLRITFEKSGKRYAVGHNDGRIRIYRYEGDELEFELEAPKPGEPPWHILFSNDGRYLAARYHRPNAPRSGMTTVVWDLEQSGRKTLELPKGNHYRFSADGTAFVTIEGDSVSVFELATGKRSKSITPTYVTDGATRSLVINENGTEIAVSQASEGLVEFWNIEGEPRLIRRIETNQNVYSMAWDSQRSLFVIGGHRGELYFWRGSLDEEPQTMELHQNTIHRMHLHPTRELVATAAWDASVRLTDLVAAEEVLKVKNVELTANGFLKDDRLGLVNDVNNLEFNLVKLLHPCVDICSGADGAGNVVSFLPGQSRIVARSVGELMEFWDTEEKQLLHAEPAGHILDIEFSHSGKQVFLSGNGGLLKWDVALVTEGSAIELHLRNRKLLLDSKTNRMVFNGNTGSLLVGSGSKVIEINPVTGEKMREVCRHKNLSGFQLTADEKFLVTGTWHGKGARVWDMESGEMMHSVADELSSLSPATHPIDADVFYAGRIDAEKYSIDSGKLIPDFGWHGKKYPGGVRFSPNGQWMMSGSFDFQMMLLDGATEKPLAEFDSARQVRIVSAEFSPDSKKLALACFENLQLIDLEEIRVELDSLGLAW